MVDIRRFDSYRKYLRALFAESRAGAPGLSLDAFGRRLGLGGSLFRMILSGQRKLSAARIHAVSSALKHSDADWSYFEALVLRQQATSPAMRARYRRRLRALAQADETTRDAAAPATRVWTARRAMLDDTLVPALFVYENEVRPDRGELSPAEAAAAFGITPERAARALASLAESGMRGGGSAPRQVVFSRTTHIRKQKSYVVAWLDEARARVDSSYEDASSTFMVETVSTTDESLAGLRAELRALFDRYSTDASPSDAGRRVIQAAVQLLPLTDHSRQ